jgi:hypothetical protein
MSVERERLNRLQEMANLVFDARTQKLRQENHARDVLKSQLDALNSTRDGAGTLWPASELVAFGYQQWAAVRRAEINATLARQTALCLTAADEARLAFGRKEALEKLAQKRLGAGKPT